MPRYYNRRYGEPKANALDDQKAYYADHVLPIIKRPLKPQKLFALIEQLEKDGRIKPDVQAELTAAIEGARVVQARHVIGEAKVTSILADLELDNTMLNQRAVYFNVLAVRGAEVMIW
jgi:hypothetical protein